MQIELPQTMRAATRSDWRQLGNITGEAFAEDPVNRWIFGTPRAITSAMTVLARSIYSRHGICHLVGDQGAAMWIEHDQQASMGLWAMLSFAAGLARHASKGALKRATTAGETMAKHHPKEPHLYLFTIGTRKSARGKGVGKALLAPTLAACDRVGKACYLENSNPDNHGFYRAHGFERMQIFPCGEGGPPMEAMWRAPRAS